MSYDGGLSVKVANSELLKIMKAHLKNGTFEGSKAIEEMIGKRYKRMTLAVDYEYLEVSYVSDCPRNLQGVLDLLIALLTFYAEGDVSDEHAFEDFVEELQSKRDSIDANYRFVEWLYIHANGSEETYRFEDGTEQYELS